MTTPTVLVVDDEPDILQLLEITLSRMQLSTRKASSIAEAKASLKAQTPDLCLTDMKLPDGNGLTLIEHMQNDYPDVPVAMITAHGSVESAIEALKLGAFDFVTKPLALEKLRELVAHALKTTPANTDVTKETLVGETPAMGKLRDQIRKVARSQAPVHIHGESGTGKEVVARLIHQSGPRQDQPFIAVNCGAIPADLVESELFGHKKGAFTGAVSDKSGLFLAANGGTLLLDEVADLPLPMQVKLLRVIQEKSVRPVGSETEIPIDIRLLSATHKNLAQEVQNRTFRDDLYYRINVIGLQVPALRERLDDIPVLVTHILMKIAEDQSVPARTLTDGALSQLMSQKFPGNIRELENILARASALTETGHIDIDDLDQQQDVSTADYAVPEAPAAPNQLEGESTAPITLLEEVNGDLETYLASRERQILTEALTAHRWNRTSAARSLGISFRSLRYRLKKLGLED
ncbi:two-component response regulator PilR [marine gamma proteobacterium HTCC2080]|nr:two-component response regulator PilR [marine gamma proteobacterium HTCC2080]